MLNRTSEFQSLDDLLYATYNDIISKGQIVCSKRGDNLEITNYSATLLNPRIRTSMSLDRKLVKSKFAEFAWFLSKDESKEYITPYISAYNDEEQENNKILGAYGSKIFGNIETEVSQYERIIEQLSKRAATKQAYLSISDCQDYRFRGDKFSSPPCTIGLHFLVRDYRMNLTTYMRSNDAYLGLPHDLFCFTMLQEIICFRTNLKMGSYTHCATSMHIYDKHMDRVELYLKEGLHEPIQMPPVKSCDDKLLDLVSQEFNDADTSSNLDKLDSYWRDYSMFANKNSKFDKWKESFSNSAMKVIAANSIAK